IHETDRYKYLRKFKVTRLNSTIFEYVPVIENLDIQFKVETQEINNIKFQKKFGVKYDVENDMYVYDLSMEDLFIKFGHFLDENYQIIEDEEAYQDGDWNDHRNNEDNDDERDYFEAMTDGQLGDYDEFTENGGNIDDIDTW